MRSGCERRPLGSCWAGSKDIGGAWSPSPGRPMASVWPRPAAARTHNAPVGRRRPQGVAALRGRRRPGVALSADGKYLASGRPVRLRNRFGQGGRPFRRPRRLLARLRADGKRLAVGYDSPSTFTRCPRADGSRRFGPGNHRGQYGNAIGLAFSPDGSRLAAVHPERGISFLEVDRTGKRSRYRWLRTVGGTTAVAGRPMARRSRWAGTMRHRAVGGRHGPGARPAARSPWRPSEE